MSRPTHALPVEFLIASAMNAVVRGWTVVAPRIIGAPAATADLLDTAARVDVFGFFLLKRIAVVR